MLKIEDFKVGDELEFISDEDKRRFTNSYYDNVSMVSNCFPKGTGEITLLGVRWIEFKGDCSRLKVINSEELQYFRKVETKKEVVDTPEGEFTYVNAGIKSVEEMYKRLLEGEVFYLEDNEFYFKGDRFYTRWSTYKESGVSCAEKYKHFQVKKPWYEFASEENPILCKVWDVDSDGKKYQVQFDLISGFDIDEQECYIGEDGCSWMNATPVKPSECFQG